MLTERAKRAAESTYDFVDAHMRHAQFELNQFNIIADRRDQITSAGKHIVDLGVYKGGSTRALAKIFPDAAIHGFDSFEGLPEAWSHVGKGSFGDVRGELPSMPPNVTLLSVAMRKSPVVAR